MLPNSRGHHYTLHNHGPDPHGLRSCNLNLNQAKLPCLVLPSTLENVPDVGQKYEGGTPSKLQYGLSNGRGTWVVQAPTGRVIRSKLSEDQLHRLLAAYERRLGNCHTELKKPQ